MKGHRVSAVLLALVGWGGCDDFTVDPQTTGQEFLFEVSYVNFAWGLRWVGFVIEANGDVVGYERQDPWAPADPESVTDAELADKFLPGRQLIGHIARPELFARFSRIDDVGRDYDSPELACIDAGGVSYLAYEYDGATERYTPVVLREEGDLIRQNTSRAGRDLANWLGEVADDVGISELTSFRRSGLCVPE